MWLPGVLYGKPILNGNRVTAAVRGARALGESGVLKSPSDGISTLPDPGSVENEVAEAIDRIMKVF